MAMRCLFRLGLLLSDRLYSYFDFHHRQTRTRSVHFRMLVGCNLATVDSDWMGLISPRTMWFCLKGYEPRVRHSEESINGWATRRLKTALTHPSQLWDVKSTQGDKSDNLPAGSPLDVISLLEPPDQYKLWLNSDFQTRLSLVFDNPTRPIPAAKAIEYLQRQGFRAFIRYNDLLDDWQPWYPEPDLA